MVSRRQFIASSSVAASAALVAGCAEAADADAAEDLPPAIKALTSMRSQATPISADERRGRIEKARGLMRDNRIDALMLTGGTSMVYFTGMSWGLSERLLAAIIPAKGDAFLITPKFEEERALEQDWSRQRSDWAAITGLFALLTFSPCEAFLPVFLTGAKYGWPGFLLLSAILAIATVTGMVTFTWLTMLGLQRLRVRMLEKYEPLIISAVFCLLGILVIMFES